MASTAAAAAAASPVPAPVPAPAAPAPAAPAPAAPAPAAAAEVLRSFATVREMLRDRGLPDLSSLDAVADADVAAQAAAASVFAIDLPSCAMRVVYNLNAKFRTPDVKPLLTTQAPPGVRQFIVVVRERPVQGKGVEELSTDVQMFTLRELQYNVSRNVLVPRHEPVRDEAEIERVLRRYAVKSRLQLPLILSTDPVARYLALKPGQLVRVTRPSPSAGTYTLYRCCHFSKR